MKRVERARIVWNKVITALMVFAGVLIVVDTIAVSLTVILRKTLGIGWSGYFELTEYSLLWIAFLPAAWLLKNDLHIRVDMIVSHLKPRPNATTNIVASIFCTVILAIITWYGFKLTWNDYHADIIVSTVLRPPKWPIEAIIPVAGFLLFIQSVLKTWGHLTGLKRISNEPRTEGKL
jgi:TRAP-type C4-dicarboxylate transport system permease small subunit